LDEHTIVWDVVVDEGSLGLIAKAVLLAAGARLPAKVQAVTPSKTVFTIIKEEPRPFNAGVQNLTDI